MCGYSEVDGERVKFCVSDPDYPSIEEFDFVWQKLIFGDEWSCTIYPKTRKAEMVIRTVAYGKSKEEAKQNLIEAYYQNPAKTS
jgi:uncharacterized protein (DUF1919 family)